MLFLQKTDMSKISWYLIKTGVDNLLFIWVSITCFLKATGIVYLAFLSAFGIVYLAF